MLTPAHAQGVRLMHEFQWLLNPRQVVDLTAPGPDGRAQGPRPVRPVM